MVTHEFVRDDPQMKGDYTTNTFDRDVRHVRDDPQMKGDYTCHFIILS